jgi:signal peptidase I
LSFWHAPRSYDFVFEEADMTSEMTSRRVPWVALALSLLSAGVGHLYCGRIAKGLPLYFAWLLVPLGFTMAAFLPPSATGLVLLMLLPAVVVAIVYLYAAIDAWRFASQIGSGYSLRDYNRASIYWLLIVVQLIYSIGLIAGVRGLVYEAFRIPTRSKSPTILPGDRSLARKLWTRDHVPERGDLIVYRNPTLTGATRFIGRVVAVAGDHLEIRGNRLSINGQELEVVPVPDESVKSLGTETNGRVAMEENAGHRYFVTYANSSSEGSASGEFEATVPEHHAFVLGDNRARSRDSRSFGSIHLGDIVGEVDYIYWPSDSWSRFGVANERLR